MKNLHLITIVLVLVFAVATFICPNTATADTATEIDRNVKNSLESVEKVEMTSFRDICA